MIRRVCLLFLFSTLTLFCPFIWEELTGEFRLAKLPFALPHNTAWEVNAAADEAILQGTFTFLARGAQSFVFESEDKKWVLKLFRYDRWVHPWRKFIRNHWLKKQGRLPFDQKIDRLFCSTKLAFEKAADLTGLVYIHLNKKENLPTILLKDRLGRVRPFNLSSAYFAIQRRASPLPEVFLEAIENNDEKKFKALTRSFVHLLQARVSKGIRNTDTKVHVNFGFWNETAIEWDFGNYCLDPEMKSEEEIHRFLLKPERYMMGKWVETFREEVSQCDLF